MTLPLVLLAVPSVIIGFITIGPLLYGDFFKDAIFIDAAKHPALKEMATQFHGATAMAVHSLTTLPFILALAGVVVAWWFYLLQPALPKAIDGYLKPLRTVLENKYYMDWFNEHVLAKGARLLGMGLWKGGDQGLIDGALVNGSARAVGSLAGVVRQFQTGRLYTYALVMVLGIFAFMTWRLLPYLKTMVL